MKNEKELFTLFHESNTNLILGGKGTGKTNFTSEVMRLLVSLGYEIWTNIHFFSHDEVPLACTRGKLPKGITYLKVPQEIHTVSTLSELLYGLLEQGRKAVFIDEAGIVSPTGISRDTKTMKQLAYVIRHFDCAFTLITQVAGSVPPDLRDNLVDYRLEILKLKRGLRKLQIGKRKIMKNEEGENEIQFPVVDTKKYVPKSHLPYDGDFPSTFKIDIDLKRTLDEFGKVKSSLELEAGKGKEILDKLLEAKIKPISKKEQIQQFIKDNPDIRHKDVAKTFQTSKGYVDKLSHELRSTS